MGLFKRLVIAIEKIADRKPLDAEQMLKVLETALKNQTALEEAIRVKRMNEAYHRLKVKEANHITLTVEDIEQIRIGDEMVKEGKLNKYK